MAILTTTSAMAYSDGASMYTFRMLNRGGNWNEFFANWDNGTWSCDQFPGSRVTNMTNPGDDSPVITISGGTFVLNTFYSLIGSLQGMTITGVLNATSGMTFRTGV
jgi:hypothetical protein